MSTHKTALSGTHTVYREAYGAKYKLSVHSYIVDSRGIYYAPATLSITMQKSHDTNILRYGALGIVEQLFNEFDKDSLEVLSNDFFTPAETCTVDASGTIVLTDDEVRNILHRESDLQESGAVEKLHRERQSYIKLSEALSDAQNRVYDLEAELEQTAENIRALEERVQGSASS